MENKMELGDLQREVAAAWQKPYVRLHGLEGFAISKAYKIGIKNSRPTNLGRLRMR